jgi:hypothetical protein
MVFENRLQTKRSMLPDEFRAELNKLWADFWPATDIKPLAVIDFINLIFFTRYLEEAHEEKEQASVFYSKPAEVPIYGEDQEDMRWSSFQKLDKQNLYVLFNRKDDGLLHFIKSTPEYKKWPKLDKEGQPLVPTPDLLASTVKLISSLEVANGDSRAAINDLLLKKIQTPAEPPKKVVNINPETKREKQRLTISDWKTSVILLIIFVSGFVLAFFYFGSRQNTRSGFFKTAGATVSNPEKDSLLVPVAETKSVKKEKTKSVKSSRKTEKKQRGVTKPKAASPRKKAAPVQKSDTGDVKAELKIISKAYFHNGLDENTPRDAFVVH